MKGDVYLLLVSPDRIFNGLDYFRGSQNTKTVNQPVKSCSVNVLRHAPEHNTLHGPRGVMAAALR